MTYRVVDLLVQHGFREINRINAKADGHNSVHIHILTPVYLKFIPSVLNQLRNHFSFFDLTPLTGNTKVLQTHEHSIITIHQEADGSISVITVQY